jgi:C4-dicarboxylate-specific signal transduction histidine kinase
VVDDAIKINSTSLNRHRITVVQAFEEVPRVLVDKHLVLQILVNLLRNAKQAIESSGREERRVVVKIQGNGGEFVKITVQDSGSGIAPENLTRIFSHGFTTKKDGHGFGLHSSALAATGMGGALSAHSDGPGTGAVFTLDLPVARVASAAAA